MPPPHDRKARMPATSGKKETIIQERKGAIHPFSRLEAVGREREESKATGPVSPIPHFELRH